MCNGDFNHKDSFLKNKIHFFKFKFFSTILLLFASLIGCSFNNTNVHKVTFEVTLKNSIDNKKVFISGDQPELGNWKPDLIELTKINDSTFEKTMSFKDGEKIQFKFTSGTWWQEALNSKRALFKNLNLKVKNDTLIKIKVYSWKNTFKNGIVVLNEKRFRPEREQLAVENFWRYHPGNNFEWAAENYNDSSWREVDSYLKWKDSTGLQWDNVGWFRFHFIADTSIWNKTLALSINQLGASEIYYNGKLLYSFGEIGKSEKDFKPQQVRIWKELKIEPKLNQLFAVRYANYNWRKQEALGFTPGFILYLKDVNTTFTNVYNQTYIMTLRQMIFTIIPLILFLLHITLYGFYPKLKANLFYAICILGFGGITYFGYQKFISTDPNTIILFYRLNNVSVPIAIFFGLLMGYEINYDQLPKRWLLFLIIFISLFIYSYLNPGGDTTYTNYIFFGITMLDLLLTSVFSKTHSSKEGSWIMFAGLLFLFTFIGLQILTDFAVITPIFNTSQIFVYGMLGLAISMSIFLSYNFSLTNRNLEKQLVKVKQLSEKTIEQERMANKLELERRIIQVENERKSKELESARALQLSLLPKSLPKFQKMELAAFMETASEVGGDYYDIINFNPEVSIIAAGDATGHGIKAGTLVAVTKSLLFENSKNLHVSEILKNINDTLLSMQLGNLYMGLTLLKLNGYAVELSSAGMPPVIVYRKGTNQLEEVVIKRMPLGATNKLKFELYTLNMNPGDMIVLLSDGMPELFNKEKKMYEYERVKELLFQHRDKTPQEIINQLKTAINGWLNGSQQTDDITFVIIRYN